MADSRIAEVRVGIGCLRLAQSSVAQIRLCQVPLRIGYETSIFSLVFGGNDSEALLGAASFEEFGLSVDQVNYTTVPISLNLRGFSPEEHAY